MDDSDQDPLEDLNHMIQILLEEPDKLQKVLSSGAKVIRNYFIFTCLGGSQDTYAINSVSREVCHLPSVNSIPEEGRLVTDTEEIVCIISGLLEYVECIYQNDKLFTTRLNPNNYIPGNCFSPC